MMIYTHRLLLPALLLLIGLSATALPVAAQTPVQTSPKAPAPGLMDDPLLQQKITLNLKDVNINQAVEALAKTAKISMVVERPATLALHPVTVALNQAKLRDVMDMLGQLYGYRWRRKSDVFLLTLVPQQADMDKFGEEAMKTIYDQVLTPEQRAKVDADGYISGKDLTPGQQGIISGYLQDMMGMLMSNNLSLGKVVIDRKNKTFSINAGDRKGDGSKP